MVWVDSLVMTPRRPSLPARLVALKVTKKGCVGRGLAPAVPLSLTPGGRQILPYRKTKGEYTTLSITIGNNCATMLHSGGIHRKQSHHSKGNATVSYFSSGNFAKYIYKLLKMCYDKGVTQTK